MDISDYLRRHGATHDSHGEDPHMSLFGHGKPIEYNQYQGRSIAVFTSGGDSQGMNSAVRAVVRFGKYLGCKVYFIKEGYQGMVDGGDHIEEAHWSSVSGIINKGGTMIGSARCMDFRERPGRLKAAKNLIDRSITNLVVIGGDGSLTGANLFRNEWSGLVQELVDTNQISQAAASANAHLNIVGMVGSIDNDFCGTDMTIGTDSALHRIIDAVDCIIPTASSHQRTFIMEVMGRHCGYLALVAAIVSEADFVFIPEWPPATNWPEKLCKKLIEGRDSGHRLNIIIVAEGAVDRQGMPITAEQVRQIIVDKLQQDTRVTVLGHIQRGGAPSAFDRVLGCRMGIEAVLTLMEATPNSEAKVVSLVANTSVSVPLMECVHKTQAVARAMGTKNWEVAVQLRGSGFKRNLDTYLMLTQSRPKHIEVHEGKPALRIGVMHVGAPCGGMNAAVRSFVRNCILLGHQPVAIHSGVEGLVDGNFEDMTWESVNGWTPKGGAMLGTKRTVPSNNLDKIAAQLKSNNIQGLLIIGGFEAYNTALSFADARKNHDAFRIPMVTIPATISNNVPGTDFSIGSDTAINVITEICDKLRQSAAGTKQRVFIVEIMGGFCGYLTTMASLASGADIAYVHEEYFGIKDIMHDISVLKGKIEQGKISTGLILRNEKASQEYTTDNLTRIYTEEGKGVFTVRNNVLGHMQQGGLTSPFDRNLGTELGARATYWLIQKCEANLHDGQVITQDKDSATLLGLRQKSHHFSPVQNLRDETDFPHRRSKQQWWLQIRSMMKMLVHHHNIEVEVEDHEAEEEHHIDEEN